jgi:hypothetical protein
MSPEHRASRPLQAIVIAAVAVLLAACASAPSGHYHFALAADDVREPRQWSLQSLPPRGRINLVAQIREEANRKQVSHVILVFGDPGATFALAGLDMSDPGCQGSYSFSLEHGTQSLASTVDYFDRRLPWGSPLKIRAEWWPDGRLEIEIGDVGRQVLILRQAVDRIQIKVLSGGLPEGNLDFENPSTR